MDLEPIINFIREDSINITSYTIVSFYILRDMTSSVITGGCLSSFKRGLKHLVPSTIAMTIWLVKCSLINIKHI
jgi:hypothetical protein